MQNRHLLFRTFAYMQTQQDGSVTCGKSKAAEIMMTRHSEFAQSSQSASHIDLHPGVYFENDACQCPDEEIQSAEKALGALYLAIAQEYGPEEAALAAHDWIEEVRRLAEEGRSSWWLVTVAAARRLAERVIAPFHL